MPDALDRKYPNAGRELGWFSVFPSQTLSIDPRVGIVRRHHVSALVIQKAVRAAAREARIHKPVSVHTLRHCFVTHPFAPGSEADRPLLPFQFKPEKPLRFKRLVMRALAENVIGEAMAAELLGVSTWQLIEMLDSPPDDGDDSKPAGANRYPV